MKNTFKWYWLRWITGWGNLLTGLVYVVTLGFWDIGWNWKTDCWFLDCAEKELFDEANKKRVD